MKTCTALLFLLLISAGAAPLKAQPVFVKRYDQNSSMACLSRDADGLVLGGSHFSPPTGADFQLMGVDTSGSVRFTYTYDFTQRDILRFVLPLPGRGYVLGGNSWGRPGPGNLDADSSSLLLARLDTNGQVIRARKLVTATGKGGILTGLASLPGGGYAFSAIMKGANNLPRLLVGLVDHRDSLVNHFDFPYSTRSNLGPPTQNIVVTDSGALIVGWNFLNGNVNEIRLVKVKDSLMVWQRRMVGDRMLGMAYAPGVDSLALYVVDSANSSHGIVKVSLQNQGAVAWGAANTLNSGALALASTASLHLQNGHVASLLNSHFTFWQGNNVPPEGFSLPERGRMTDFVMMGRKVFLAGTSLRDGKYVPLLVKSIVADTVSNCFTYYRSSPGFLPLTLNNSPVPVSLQPPRTLVLQDTAVTLIRQVLLASDSLICVGPGKVWPGDANSDGVANNRDVLNVGLAYGLAGNPRLTVDSTWAGFPASNWLSTFNNGTDYKQADCNGDGVVDRRDLRPIFLNYRRLHGKTGSDCNDPGPHPPFYLLPHADSVEAGDTLRVAVMLGTAALPVDSLYGLAFSLCYDHTLVDSASVRFFPTNSWMGSPADPDSPLIHLAKDFYNEGLLEVGMSRSNQRNAQGYGHIAMVEIFTIDDLAGKKDLVTQPLGICLEEVFAQTAGEIPVCLDALPDTVILYQKKVSTGFAPGEVPPGFACFPNPVRDICYLELPAPCRLTLLDLSGKEIQTREWQAGPQEWDLSFLPSGLYQLSGKSENGFWWQKLVKK